MAKKSHDLSRIKRPSPLGTSLFVGLRAADVFWQYKLIRHGWASQLLQKLGGAPVQPGLVINPSTGLLQPYYLAVLLLSAGSSFKQITNILFISEQEMVASTGVLIGVFNTVFNSLNTIFALWSLSSQVPQHGSSWSGILGSPAAAIGLGLYVVGISTELISELQRRSFKKDPANKGKPYGGGLFSLATNINYGAYTLWRGGYALTTGGYTWGLLTFSFFFRDFVTRGVPTMDEYLVGRYGQAYKDIKARVKYSLLPGIY